MKCSNCGKNDVNFYYESNVNGKITRQQLCSECAQKLGFGNREMFSFPTGRSLFGDMFGEFADFFGGRRRLFDMTMPEMLLPELMSPRFGLPQTVEDRPAEPESPAAPEKADETMDRRRQVNMLRAQMQEAVAAEDFEKAAQLRDRIRAIEGGESK